MAKHPTPGRLLSQAMFAANPLSTVIGRKYKLKEQAPEPLRPPMLRIARLILDGDNIEKDVALLIDDAFYLYQKNLVMKMGVQTYHRKGGGIPTPAFMLLPEMVTDSDQYDIERFIEKARRMGAKL